MKKNSYIFVFVGILSILSVLLLLAGTYGNKINIEKTENKNKLNNQENSEEVTNKNDMNKGDSNKKKVKKNFYKNRLAVNDATDKVVIKKQYFQPDDEMYVKSIQNLGTGNYITYDKGYYYYQSQKDYSLCKMDKNEKDVKKLADVSPGSIYVKGNKIYFINFSDNRSLYTIHTDGTKLKKITNMPIQELIVSKNKIYFRSMYEKKYDILNIYLKKPEKLNQYVYSMNLDGTDIHLLLGGAKCNEFITNGKRLFYVEKVKKSKLVQLCSSSMDGMNEKVLIKTDNLSYVLPYQGYLYYLKEGTDFNILYRAKEDGSNEEKLMENVDYFTISNATLYGVNHNIIRSLHLQIGEIKRIFDYDDDKQDEINFPLYHSRDFFVVNGQLFTRYWGSDKVGVVWHKINEQSGICQIFEEADKFNIKDFVSWTSVDDNDAVEFSFPKFYTIDDSKYLSKDLGYYDYYKKTKKGDKLGEYIISLPKFNNNIKGYRKINNSIKTIYNYGIKDKKKLYRKYMNNIEDLSGFCTSLSYDYLYVSDQYVEFIIDISSEGYHGQQETLIYNKNTGEILQVKDVFKVERSVYKDKIARILYKYMELTHLDNAVVLGDVEFNSLQIEKVMNDAQFVFSKNGIIICFDKSSLLAGCEGWPKFEIPYTSLGDIIDFK